MALPETNQKPVSMPAQSVNSNVPEQSAATLGQNPRAALAQSKDPRQLAANLADKYLHVGSQLGFALFVVWGIIALGTVPAVLIGIGLIPTAIFNMLLFSPKSVYRLSEFILDFFGFGEVLQAADELGLSKLNITIADWQKALIVFYDIIVAIIIVLFISTIFISTCTIANSSIGTVVGKTASIVSANSGIAAISGFCK
jgi:hypothetical protein